MRMVTTDPRATHLPLTRPKVTIAEMVKDHSVRRAVEGNINALRLLIVRKMGSMGATHLQGGIDT